LDCLPKVARWVSFNSQGSYYHSTLGDAS
jgi:hypothetical protein